MLYAILCYNDENAVASWSKEEDDACMVRLAQVEDKMAQAGRLGPVARLLPTTSATTLRKNSGGHAVIVDGPFAETKEQFLGFFVADCDTLEQAHDFARDLAVANPGTGAYEIRPLAIYKPGAIGKSAISPGSRQP